MGLMSELGVTGDVDAGEVEGRAAAGSIVPQGIHHAILNGCGAAIAEGVKRGYELTFRVLAGPGKDGEVREVLWFPKGEDDKKDQRAKDRTCMFAWKLGLLKKERKGGKDVFTEIEGKHDFGDVLGAQCFIEVRHEEEEWTDKKTGRQRKGMKAKLTYYPGILALTDSQCAKIPRGTAADVAAAVSGTAGVGAGAGGAGAKKDEFSDL